MIKNKYYHASPVTLQKKDLVVGHLFYVSDNFDFVVSNFFFGKEYKYLYEITLNKTKSRIFDIRKKKCLYSYLRYLKWILKDKLESNLKLAINNGRISFIIAEHLIPLLNHLNYNICVFDEGGDNDSKWGKLISKEYGEVESLGILDPKVIKIIKNI
jgi:hypothetical protein